MKQVTIQISRLHVLVLILFVSCVAWAADTKISALTAAASVAAANEFAINEAGTSKKVTAAQIKTFTGPTLIAGNSGTVSADAAPSQTWQILTSDAATNSSATPATVMTSNTLAAGTWKFRYDILVQTSATTTSVSFAVNAGGTVTSIVYHLFFPSQGVTAATGIADQDIDVTTGAVWAHLSTRTDNTLLGPTTDLDTINVDVHYIIEGVLVTSTSGSLTLDHASEGAVATTVQSGTMLTLQRFQ
jgi:hypothetical protein